MPRDHFDPFWPWEVLARADSLLNMVDDPNGVDASIRAEVATALHRLDFMLNLAAARGVPVTLDLVERETERCPGVVYTTVIDGGGVK